MPLENGIAVDWLDEPPCIRMVWGQHVTDKDVQEAFERIQMLLNKVKEPRCVLVDISQVANMPLTVTFQSAVTGPYRHPRLRNWLIVEPHTNRIAHVAEKLMSSVTRRHNVRWFKSEQDALDFMRQGEQQFGKEP